MVYNPHMDIRISFVLEKNLTPEQKRQITILNEESFGNVSKREIEENFIAKPFARLIAYDSEQAVGTLQLYKRENEFSGTTFSLGGIGGVCVAKHFRRRGIGKQLVEQAMMKLREQECDVVCLNTEPDESAFRLYEKIGFKLMEREVSFENSRGNIVRDYGTMLAPLNSKKTFDLIMKSKLTLHYGVGCW